MNEQIATAISYGASEEDLMMIRQQAAFQMEEIARQLSEHMFEVDMAVAEWRGEAYALTLHQINREVEDSIIQARNLRGLRGRACSYS